MNNYLINVYTSLGRSIILENLEHFHHKRLTRKELIQLILDRIYEKQLYTFKPTQLRDKLLHIVSGAIEEAARAHILQRNFSVSKIVSSIIKELKK